MQLPINPGFAKKTSQVLEKVPLSALLDEQTLEQTNQEFENALVQELSSEQIQERSRHFPLVMSQLKLFLIKLKQYQLIDSELAGLFCAILKEFEIVGEKNAITQEKKEKLDALLRLAKQKLTNLIANKQIEPLLAKPLIFMLPIMTNYMKRISI